MANCLESMLVVMPDEPSLENLVKLMWDVAQQTGALEADDFTEAHPTVRFIRELNAKLQDRYGQRRGGGLETDDPDEWVQQHRRQMRRERLNNVV